MAVRLLLVCAVLLANSLFVSCRKSQAGVSGSSRPTLIQSYEISGTRGYTTVKAKVFFRGDEGSLSYPKTVEFNSGLMRNEYLDESKDPEQGCPIDSNLPRVVAQHTVPQKADGSVYSLLQEGFKPKNKVTITADDGTQQSFSVDFEPKEFAESGGIVLSRSKDNVLRLKGKGDGADPSKYFGINQAGHSIDQKAISYDQERDVLLVPAKAVRKLKIGKANLWLISSAVYQTGFITYNEMICVPIVD